MRSVVGALLVSAAFAASPADWRNRTIYQLLTDRFARTDGSQSPCNDLSDYCGGSFDGIVNELDYIAGMGFDAIWISPVVANTQGGYHGYWAQNLYQINPYFGSSQDLANLVQAALAKNIWVMLDVVGNHMGITSLNQLVPFNDSSHYHSCNPCPSNCQIQDFTNQPQVELCRLAGLLDLNQTNSYVANTLNSWISMMVSKYGFQGLRVDTTPEVAKPFWQSFNQAAGVFAIGEVFNGDIGYVSGYQGQALDSVLSYPMFFTLRNVFQQQQSLNNLQSTIQAYSAFPDQTVLGTFVDNHDNPRFLNGQSDLKLYQNALTYVLMGTGIPIVYYGTEAGFNGGSDPNCREVLWTTGFNTQQPLYQLLSTMIGFRKAHQVWLYPQVQRYSDDQFYAFTRGNAFVALTNVGSNGPQVSRQITYHPYSDGTKLCNVFYPTADCILVVNGAFTVYLDGGESKLYYPTN